MSVSLVRLFRGLIPQPCTYLLVIGPIVLSISFYDST